MTFDSPVVVKEVHIKFQGGFAGQDCHVEGRLGTEEEMEKMTEFYPDDINALQVGFFIIII